MTNVLQCFFGRFYIQFKLNFQNFFVGQGAWNNMGTCFSRMVSSLPVLDLISIAKTPVLYICLDL